MKMRSGDDAGFVRDFLAEPAGAHEEAADEEAEDADGASSGKCGGELGVEAAEEAGGIEESEAEANREVIEGHEGEGAESPEDEGVGDAGQGALADDFGLAEHFPEEVPDAFADGSEAEARVFFDLRMRLRMGLKRLKKRPAEARMSANRRSFSHVVKLWGSASVAERRFISEPTHDTRSGLWQACSPGGSCRNAFRMGMMDYLQITSRLIGGVIHLFPLIHFEKPMTIVS